MDEYLPKALHSIPSTSKASKQTNEVKTIYQKYISCVVSNLLIISLYPPNSLTYLCTNYLIRLKRIFVLVKFSQCLSLRRSDPCRNKSYNSCIIKIISFNHSYSSEASVYLCHSNVLIFVEMLGIIYDFLVIAC